MQTIELASLLTNTLFPYQRQALARNISLKVQDDLVSFVQISTDIPSLTLLIDTVMKSTLDHTSASQIVFSTRQLMRSDEDLLLEFSIRHDGALPRDRERIAYFRSIIKVKALVEALNGKSEWDLSSVHGTSLKFIIRCGASEMPQKKLNLCTQSLMNKRVLVVEDNDMNQKSITRILEKEGVSYTVAADGKEAIELLEKSQHYDLVLMDLHMPHMDGYQTTTYLRKKLNASIPVVGMSGGDQDEYALKCFEAGMNQFIQKPFSPEMLITQLCSFFEPLYLQMDHTKALSA